MDENIKTRWVAKLRDPNIKQAKFQLRDKDAYCCLGVLCQMFIDETGEGEWKRSEEGLAFVHGAVQEAQVLPEIVQEWAGLDESSPMVPFKETITGLAELNDGADTMTQAIPSHTFLQIADIIEERL